MKKNVASQVIGAQMVSATDGSAFTSTVTVYVTGDGGTQAIGSVGSGICTHEGNGFHTYAPAQAETNYDHIGFTFIGTGAVPATIQVYTSFPQTGDNFARLGAPAGASISADIAGVQSDTNDIQTRLPAALVSGRMDSSVGAMAANTLTASALATDAGEEIATATWAAGTRTLTALDEDSTTLDLDATIRSAVGLAAANLDTQLDAIPTTAEIADGVWDEPLSGHLTAGTTGAALDDAGAAGDPWATALPGSYTSGQAGFIVGTNLDTTVSSRASQTSLNTLDDYVDTEVAAIKAKTDNLPASPAATSDIPTATQNADALLNRDMSAVSDTNARSPLNALRFLRNKWALSGTTLTVYEEDDATTAWTATVTAAPGADPISGNDPA